jgi:2-polyprenyl-3-methyl-5-hydroxy-6-metoxy-1,4-benzoquinol methylase
LGTFDLVFASEVIEHIVHDRRLFCHLSEHLADKGLMIVTTPSKRFVNRVAKLFPGFDAISSIQDGGHVRVGYEPAELSDMARDHSLVSISCDYLGRMPMKELGKREVKRNQGAYVNSARFNLSWLVRDICGRTTAMIPEDECWSLAMAFQRIK